MEESVKKIWTAMMQGDYWASDS